MFDALFTVIPAECENGDVRLRGGNDFEGRVEFCVRGEWGQVCDMGFTTGDAEVVCHQLGHGRTNGESSRRRIGTYLHYTALFIPAHI